MTEILEDKLFVEEILDTDDQAAILAEDEFNTVTDLPVEASSVDSSIQPNRFKSHKLAKILTIGSLMIPAGLAMNAAPAQADSTPANAGRTPALSVNHIIKDNSPIKKLLVTNTAQTKSSTSTLVSNYTRNYTDYNMHAGWGSVISSRGCGVVSLSDTVSFETGEQITPTQIAPEIKPWFSSEGTITDVPDPFFDGKISNYMSGAGPAIAKKYHLRFIETNVKNVNKYIQLGGAAILLSGPGILTEDSHYISVQKSKETPEGEMVEDFDPNQPGYGNDKHWFNMSTLTGNGVQTRAFVFLPLGNYIRVAYTDKTSNQTQSNSIK